MKQLKWEDCAEIGCRAVWRAEFGRHAVYVRPDGPGRLERWFVQSPSLGVYTSVRAASPEEAQVAALKEVSNHLKEALEALE